MKTFHKNVKSISDFPLSWVFAQIYLFLAANLQRNFNLDVEFLVILNFNALNSLLIICLVSKHDYFWTVYFM